jgi:hypothetical protein
MSATIAVLAESRARKQVKEMLRREGYKVSAYTAAEIKVMARVWAAMHRDELVADAKAMIAKSPELTKRYEKEQRQRAKLSSDAQTQEPQKSITSAVQISGAK